ncbi:uncharacterized protein LOC120251663 isoform X2 [Dioscorea cayenensis subsp. rotundata]|uniref:Uncharacterized protein LOC120251663 isoform X2 n=1 Tax=Dioscorea cayennensis subsp. rotundata TaxID=55577 RepID=A0AB40AML9_DIOCR|nr:uncharacterized protein LOC120251663 isoform X2 [Dioscorea cayenensis subsp. rotundata]
MLQVTKEQEPFEAEATLLKKRGITILSLALQLILGLIDLHACPPTNHFYKIMATAETRAAWQRTAHRCFVQEDAKRAPKLACYPSSSSNLQFDVNNSNASSVQDNPAPDFVNLGRKSLNSVAPPDPKWWLCLQPTLGCQKEVICEPLHASEDEFGEKGFGNSTSASGLIVDALLEESLDVEHKRTNHPLKSDWETEDEELVGWELVGHMISEKTEKGLHAETLLNGVSKSEPWWRIADKNELASLVAQKSLVHIENCDLPRPTQALPVCTGPFTCLKRFNNDLILSSSSCQKSQQAGSCNPIWLTHKSPSISSRIVCSGSHEDNTPTKEPSEGGLTFKADPSRAQLLEALCHSQTRARKAEIAAKKAHEEKQHIIKLLFRQASHLFGYKLWLHILQMEILCLQLKLNDDNFLPWISFKQRPSNKESNESTRLSRKKQKNVILSSVCLGLAGAGLLLGWAVYRRAIKCSYETNHA